VERVGELYHLRLETGNVLPIPVILVREVRVQEKDAPLVPPLVPLHLRESVAPHRRVPA
jgi:hypothetical protein